VNCGVWMLGDAIAFYDLFYIVSDQSGSISVTFVSLFCECRVVCCYLFWF